MTTSYTHKRIADPVHGTVGLSELEIDLLSTRAFQRLRNVNQLGLADLVFPGSNYSRLSHCIGVCHVTGRILDSIKRSGKAPIDDSEHQLYRLAGLLHDVGHYPFSHTFEQAVTAFYKNRKSESIISLDPLANGHDPPNLEDGDIGQTADPLNHEEVGKRLLDVDIEIHEILQKHQIDPNRVHAIFARESSDEGSVPRFANMISSDLDADRIDYLLRTARHTGLPYGSVDLDYLLSQMTLDDRNRICLAPNALRTAEHFLIGRYFDYQQVNFHKTVAGLEWVLNDVVIELLRRGAIDCSPSGIDKMLETGDWNEFDDLQVVHLIRDLQGHSGSDSLELKIRAITRRIPPKLIGSMEFLGDRGKHSEYTTNIRHLTRICNDLSIEFGIPRELWHIWGSRPTLFTKVGSYMPVSATLSDPDAIDQAVRILDGDSSKLISEVPRSLMSILAQYGLYSIRLYVMLDKDQEAQRSEILKRVKDEIALDNWIDGSS